MAVLRKHDYPLELDIESNIARIVSSEVEDINIRRELLALESEINAIYRNNKVHAGKIEAMIKKLQSYQRNPLVPRVLQVHYKAWVSRLSAKLIPQKGHWFGISRE